MRSLFLLFLIGCNPVTVFPIDDEEGGVDAGGDDAAEAGAEDAGTDG